MEHEQDSGRFTNQSSATVHGPHVQIGRNHGGIVFTCGHSGDSGQSGSVRPAQIPVPRGFVNRSAEFAALDAWLEERTLEQEDAVGVLSGLPGVGKTATACRWARLARDRFPDGQVFVDFAALRRDNRGGDLAEAAAWCLRALGVAKEFVPATLSERLALFRSHCSTRRLLIVLDDVTVAGHVAALAPGSPGSAVLATSTAPLDELSLDGTRLLALAPLDHESGTRLLADLAGPGRIEADLSSADRLVDQCGGLPLALHVVGLRLRRHTWLSVAALADELADEGERLAALTTSVSGKESSVSGALNLAYQDLPDSQARLYRLLGLLPYPLFDAGTVAACAQLTQLATLQALAGLVDAGLVHREADDRYRLHSLVRLHARALAAADDSPAEQNAVPARAMAHYLQLTALADRAIRADRLRIVDLDAVIGDAPDPFAEGTTRPLIWMEAERPALLAVLREAERHGWDRRVWQLAEVLSTLYLHHRHLGEWQEVLRIGAAAAARDERPDAEARLRSLLSRPLLDLDQEVEAKIQLERALECATDGDNLRLEASVQEFWGRFLERHDLTAAQSAFHRSRQLSELVGDQRGAALALLFLGDAQDAAGMSTTAVETLNDALVRFENCRDPRMVARAVAARGRVYSHLRDFDSAARDLRQAADQLRDADATHYEAQARVELADLLAGSGGSEAVVRTQLERAWQIYHDGGSPQAAALRARLDSPPEPDSDGAGT